MYLVWERWKPSTEGVISRPIFQGQDFKAKKLVKRTQIYDCIFWTNLLNNIFNELSTKTSDKYIIYVDKND